MTVHLSTSLTTTYPFKLRSNLEIIEDWIQEFVRGDRKEINVMVGEEYDYACKRLEELGVKWYDSLDTPEDVIIERV
jgi:hypothetical protein